MRKTALLLLLLVPCGLYAQGNGFRAGAYAMDVTPVKYPVIVNGGFTEKTAAASLDKLHARCLVLENGGTRVGIVVVDSCMMPREFLDRIKQTAAKETGPRVENMLISATHTHSAPAAMGCLGSDADPDYPTLLAERIAQGLVRAERNLKPARVGWATADATGLTHNRRWILRPDRVRNDPFGNPTMFANMHPGYQSPDFTGPSGPVDTGLSVVSVQSLEGKPIAVLCNLSMHYFGAGAVSSDYYGAFCDRFRKLAAADDPNFVAIMSQGTSGDLMWMDYGNPKSTTTLAQYADAAATKAFEAYRRIEHKGDVPLRMAQRKLSLGRRVPDEARLAWAKPILEKLKDAKPKTQPEIYAREADFLHKEPKRELILQALQIGDLGIAAIPNEVFAITGLKLKAFSPFASAFTIELANGSEGYIPPPEQHKLGGYTTWPARTAALEEGAEPRIVEEMLAMQEELSGGKRKRFTQPETERVKAIRSLKPVAFWSMGEIAGNQAADRMGLNPAKYEDRIALYLDGVEGGRCPHFAGGRMTANVNLPGTTYTAAFWFWNALPTDARPVTGYMFSRGLDGDKDTAGDHLGIGGTHSHAGRLLFYNGNERKESLAGRTPLKLREWHHVVLVREGKRVRVYLDGAAEPEIDGEIVATIPAKSQVFIGGRSDGFANFAGKIDEAVLFDRELNPTERKSLAGK